jgi:hypothetical protein
VDACRHIGSERGEIATMERGLEVDCFETGDGKGLGGRRALETPRLSKAQIPQDIKNFLEQAAR